MLDGHRRAEDRLAAIEDQDAVVVQVEQAGLDGGQLVLQLWSDLEIRTQRFRQLAELTFHAQVDATQLVVELAEQRLQ
jgi:hypothetical protein